ncbi:MFS transporter, FHS family, L-fucose permease [Methylophilus rhizosphaerae]|uniref:MFS transporter, FHS family, L-fucose permease n=1 Tax=Methylophilus rhizosphaerae TaxID=492660 RepID=A0A1G9BDJ4_9PROT|nr:sugar MFS transporter [Methylophilus rhizosphaerae]SDK37547.1 MFS transporter, FHS family, L-fucose permease [Methylophilus rhizosphaerae]
MYKKALTSLTVLFFMMGFITCLNDILVPYLKAIFALSYGQAALIQFCFFAAYGLTSIPFSKLIERIGYQKGMVTGFALAALGCLLFYPAVTLHTYGLFLGALFVLASGIVLLQVTANPCVSIIGPKETASSRLTMAQAFNSLGTFIAPFFGAYFILSTLARTTHAEGVVYPYFFIALVLVVIALVLSRIQLDGMESGPVDNTGWLEVLREKGLLLGVIGIFAYVGAEVAIGSFLVNYVMDISHATEAAAALLVAFYWGGAMVGRFIGIFTLKAFAPAKVLMTHALLSVVLIVVSMSSTGTLAIASMVLVGFCNSIMFPTIFTLGIRGLKAGQEKKGSGLLATAILGGAIVPLLTGLLADRVGLHHAFILPVLCYGYIAWFGFRSKR